MMNLPWHEGFINQIADNLTTGNFQPDMVRYEAWNVCDSTGRHVALACSKEHQMSIVSAANENEALRAQVAELKAENTALSLYKNIAAEYGLSVFEDMAELKRQRDEYKADAERLDFLDAMNRRKNEANATTYGWKLQENHNRIALTDSNIPALSVREAIDAALPPLRGNHERHR